MSDTAPHLRASEVKADGRSGRVDCQVVVVVESRRASFALLVDVMSACCLLLSGNLVLDRTGNEPAVLHCLEYSASKTCLLSFRRDYGRAILVAWLGWLRRL
jgi:hypothetical protein